MGTVGISAFCEMVTKNLHNLLQSFWIICANFNYDGLSTTAMYILSRSINMLALRQTYKHNNSATLWNLDDQKILAVQVPDISFAMRCGFFFCKIYTLPIRCLSKKYLSTNPIHMLS